MNICLFGVRIRLEHGSCLCSLAVCFLTRGLQFGHGQSNPTYLVQVELQGAVQRYVLRKKPPGQILQSAHAVEREYQVLPYIYDRGVKVLV